MKVKTQLRIGEVYFAPCPSRRKLFIQLKWEGSEFDYMRLSRGLVHKTQVSAIKHSANMISLTQD